MEDKIIHLLWNYSAEATETLCGIEVPEFWGNRRGNLHWAHFGHETCPECRAQAAARRRRINEVEDEH